MLGLILLNCALVFKLHAGGSGLNTIVVVNQTSSNSCALGNYYCQQRQVPPQNVLYINWTGGNTLWSSNDFQTNLVTPLLDMLAAVARKDFDDRRRRQTQGIAKAKSEGLYRGRPEDVDRNAGIASLLKAGESWSAIERVFGCSRATIAKVAKRAA